MTRPDTNTFRSCPAATGQHDCNGYPDMAHRCYHERTPHLTHICQCTYTWVVLAYTHPSITTPPKETP